MKSALAVVAPIVAPIIAPVAAFCLLATGTESQTPRQPLDTAALSADAAAVRWVWLAYLAWNDGAYAAHAYEPSPLWTDAEQRRWPAYDLAGLYLPDGAVPEVLSIERTPGTDAAGNEEYRIITHFHTNAPSAQPPIWSTDLTMTVYAVRSGGAWKLSNALLRTTAGWRRDTVGPITYVFAPTYRYDRARAQRAVAFVDSVAAAFALPRLAALTYYLTSSVDQVYQIMGLESPMKFGAAGGASQPVNHQLFSGIPAIGEDYRHELVHLLFAPLCCAHTSYLVSEGVPTWLGGTTGMDFPTAARGLAALLAAHPAVSLDSVLAGRVATAQFYPAGAVLVALVFEHGGTDAVKTLFQGGQTPDELRATLERLLGEPWPAVAAAWRARVMAFGNAPPH